MNHPVLCIPKVHPSVSNQHILNTIHKLNLGIIDQFYINDVMYNKTKCKKVYIHFKQWSHQSWAQALRQRLLQGDSFKVFYNQPRYWICSASYNKYR